MTTFNPEFRKNLWLELTPFRLIGMPLVILALLYIGYLNGGGEFGNSVAHMALGLYFLVTIVWGTKQASETIINEIREHTWDDQRMSVLTPWQLLWGKLFGSTVYTWYGSVISLTAYALAVSDKYPANIEAVLSLVLAGVLAHAVAMVASLIGIQKERKLLKTQTTAMLLLGIIVAAPFIGTVGSEGSVAWYGSFYPKKDFMFFTVAAYAAWSVMGAYQLMRTELQMKNIPVAWYGFLLFSMIYCGGISSGYSNDKSFSGGNVSVLAAYAVVLAATYFTAFTERKDLLSLQKTVRLAQLGEWGSFLKRAPRWLLTLPLFAATAAVLVFTADGAGATVKIASFALAGLFFLGRDIGIMLFTNLAESNRRADMLSILYLVILYGIIPAILSAIDLHGATVLFWPEDNHPAFLVILPPLLEMLLMFYLVSMRWRKRVAQTV